MNIKLADRVQQVGEYYFSTKLSEIADMRSSGIDVINIGIGSPDLKPAESVIIELNTQAQSSDQHGYQSYRGIPELRTAISEWYKAKFNVIVDPADEVLPLIGSKEGILHISMTYLQQGDQVLIPNPGYPTYRSASLLAGAEVITYDLSSNNGWQPKINVLEQRDLSRVKIMWLNYPHMPSGTPIDQAVMEKVVAFAHRHTILLCHDNPYAFILNDHPTSLLQIPGAMDVTIELNSLSKTYNMAGWRVGFMAGRSERINEVLRFKSNIDSGMFKPVQLAAIQALQLPQQWYQNMNIVYAERRQVVLAIMSALGCQVDSDQVGLFVWGKIPSKYTNSYHLVDELLNQVHIFITPGNIFGTAGAGYVRISLCSSVDVLNKALKRIKNFKPIIKTLNT